MNQEENKVEEEKDTEELKLNSLLQQKKNKIRKTLNEKGILPKGAVNTFDNYEYFSEAQYKELFTELFSKNRLDFDSSEINIQCINGSEKQPFGVLATMEYIMTDIDTGYEVKSVHSGIAIDKGDKAIYKAKTGALKSFFASTFLVATKDDPEREDDQQAKPKKKSAIEPGKKVAVNRGSITDGQIGLIKTLFKNDVNELKNIMKNYKKKKIEELSVNEASEIIKGKNEGKNNEQSNSEK